MRLFSHHGLHCRDDSQNVAKLQQMTSRTRDDSWAAVEFVTLEFVEGIVDSKG